VQLTFPDEVEAFRAEFSAWLDENLPPEADTTERPRSSAHIPEWARAFQARMFDDGWLVPAYPPEYGGRNATLFEQMVYLDELGRRKVVRTYNPQGVGIVSASVVTFGTEEQKRKWAVPVLRAERTAALGMSEPGAGSDLAGLRTRAVLDGDEFVVNGQKVWTSGAHDADVLIVFVRTDPDAAKHKGISALMIETDSPGLTRRPFPDIGGPGDEDFNEVFFDDVRVPAENLIGDLNDGWAVCNGALAHERSMLWVMWSEGLDEMVADLGADLADSPAAGDPAVMERYGKVICDAWAVRLMGYRGLAKMERGLVAAEHSLLKMMGSESQQETANLAMEALGPWALDQRPPDRERQPWGRGRGGATWMDRYWFTFAGTISGGTSEIQRNIIAERVLGLPRG
jgi:alkylation response protein AidB-like acyl-CoA dehydrogenase